MATSTTTTASKTTTSTDEGWDATKLPKSDEEFVFKDINSIPGWCDKGWAGYDQGPALQLPVDLSGKGPYTTTTARQGDTVKFTAAKGAKGAFFTVVQVDRSEEDGTIKPAQVTNASLEDLLTTEHLKVGDLGTDAKAQLIVRNAQFAKQMGIEDAKAA